MRTLACELLLFAYVAQPQHPRGSKTRFQDLAADNDSRLTAYTTWLIQLLPTSTTPTQMAIVTDRTIDQGTAHDATQYRWQQTSQVSRI